MLNSNVRKKRILKWGLLIGVVGSTDCFSGAADEVTVMELRSLWGGACKLIGTQWDACSSREYIFQKIEWGEEP